MKNILFFDSSEWQELLPITYTRPVAMIRIGILTIEEKWKIIFPGNFSFLTKEYLAEKFSANITDDNIFINSSVLPDMELIDKIDNLSENTALSYDNKLIALRLKINDTSKAIETFKSLDFNKLNIIKLNNVKKVNHLWDIYQMAESEIINDYNLLTKEKKSEKIPVSNTRIGLESQIYLAKGAIVEASILNSSTGPIFIDEDAEIMEGSMIRGPVYLGKHSNLKMGAKIYGATSIGHHCKVGGEVNNSVFLDYSNKAHDGFLGNSVIGEWCNLGADTNNSNLKNNYAKVKLWNYSLNKFIDTGNQFCGLFMGDHSKAGINTMFNTGTIVGVSANIFGPGFPRNFIPSFSWGGAHGFNTFSLPKSFETAKIMMNRRNLDFDDKEMKILNSIFEMTKEYRHWEK